MLRSSRRKAAFSKSLFQQVAETRMLLEQAVDQVVVFIERNKLKEWLAVDRYHHGLVMAELPVPA
jgi:hypothetical protein